MNILSNIRVVLSSPLYGGNIGAICRAMANTGLSDLAIAGPRAINVREARMMACAAWDIYERHQEFHTLAEAVADCGMVIGTTARLGLYRAHAATPKQLAPQVLDAARLAKVALVFGREDWGLSNDDLELCTKIIQIPSSPNYPSINLAQAVMICAHEIYVASGEFEPSEEKSPEAPSAMRERMLQLWEEALLAIGFMKADKAQHMMLGLRRVFSRGLLTVDDLKILMGIARQTLWQARQCQAPSRSSAEPCPDPALSPVDDAAPTSTPVTQPPRCSP